MGVRVPLLEIVATIVHFHEQALGLMHIARPVQRVVQVASEVRAQAPARARVRA